MFAQIAPWAHAPEDSHSFTSVVTRAGLHHVQHIMTRCGTCGVRSHRPSASNPRSLCSSQPMPQLSPAHGAVRGFADTKPLGHSQRKVPGLLTQVAPLAQIPGVRHSSTSAGDGWVAGGRAHGGRAGEQQGVTPHSKGAWDAVSWEHAASISHCYACKQTACAYLCIAQRLGALTQTQGHMCRSRWQL